MSIMYDIFEKVDLRSGMIVQAELFERAKKPAYKIWVDFGPDIGIKKTSAQVTKHYTLQSLLGRLVIGCVNLEPRNIAGFISEFLLLGCADANGDIVLLTADRQIPRGQKVY